MEILQRALREALDRNAAETVRWTKYKEQHKEAKVNIEQFTKSLEVDVMVPIGAKALMPGRLYHTNEIVVSHSNTYYSKCTAHKALEICENRLNVAESRLTALVVEANLHRNQLELPLDFDAFSSQEIIETYDEEEEKKWQSNHKKKLKEQKQREAIERQQLLSDEDDIIKRLQELELMEELENELEAIAEEDDETVQAILSERPEPISFKKRISHFTDRNVEGGDDARPYMENAGCTGNDSISSNSSCDNEDDDDDDITPEFKELERKTASMTNREKTKLFKFKLDEVQNYLENLKPRTLQDISHKTDMVFLSDHLLHAIEMMEDEFNCDRYLNGENVTTEDSDNIASPTSVPKQTILKQKKKTLVALDDDKSSIENLKKPNKLPTRKISFASEDDVKSFDVLEEPNKISSTAVLKQKKKSSITFAPVDDVKSFDVLEEPSKISSTIIYDNGPVLNLNINHSEAVFHETNEQSDVIRSPVDIYKQFGGCTTVETKKELQTKNRPQQIKQLPVDRRTRPTVIKDGGTSDKDIVAAKTEVKDMLDNIFDTRSTNEPDPLPEGSFVDSRAPKKRVSLFKQRREMKSQ